MPYRDPVPELARDFAESAAKCLLQIPLSQDFQDFFRDMEIPGQQELDMRKLRQKVENWLEKIKENLLGSSSSSSQSSSQAQSRSTSSQAPPSSSSQSSSQEELPPPLEGIIRCIINRLYYALHTFFACHPLLWTRQARNQNLSPPSEPPSDSSESPSEPDLLAQEIYESRKTNIYAGYHSILNYLHQRVGSHPPHFTSDDVWKWVRSLYKLRCDADYQPEIVFSKVELMLALMYTIICAAV